MKHNTAVPLDAAPLRALVVDDEPAIERDPQDPEMLLTAWGVGYKFADVSG